MNIISTFDGISNLAYALVQMGHTGFNYYAFEIDKNAISIARYNAKKYNYNYILMGGVENCTEEWVKSLEGGVQVYCGGSPCTSLSIACASSGKRSDGKDGTITGSSALFYEWLRIRDLIIKYNPKCPWILENVKSCTKECKDIISNLTGVQPVYLDGKYFSAQRRARYFWSNIKFEAPPESAWDTTILRDVLIGGSVTYNNFNDKFSTEKSQTLGTGCGTITGKTAQMVIGEANVVDAKYYLSEEQLKKIKWHKTPKSNQVAEIGPNPHNSQANRIYDVEGKSVTQGACGGGLGAKGGLYYERIGVIQTEYNSKEGSSPSQGSRICSDEGKTTTIPAMERGHDYFKTPSNIRRLTPVEVERLFNLPDDFTKYGIDDLGNLKEMKDGPRYRCLGNGFLWRKIAYILKHCEF